MYWFIYGQIYSAKHEAFLNCYSFGLFDLKVNAGYL